MKKIRNVMSKNVEVIRPDASLFEASQMMKNLDIGVLPVCDGDRLRGMITDRDIVVRGLAEKRNLQQMKVSDVMTKDVHYCFDDEGIDDAAELMEQKKVRRIVVLNRNKRLVGILSLGDIALESRTSGLVKRTLEEVASSPDSERSSRGFFSVVRSGLGSIVIGSAVFGLSYFFYNQREDVKETLMKVIPFGGEQKVA